MTRFEHHVTRGAQVTCGPAGPPGTHEIRIVDGAVTVVLRFGSAEEMAAFSMIPYRYVWAQTQPSVSVVDTAETVSTGVWGQGSAGAPVGESGEGGIVATARALPRSTKSQGAANAAASNMANNCYRSHGTR